MKEISRKEFIQLAKQGPVLIDQNNKFQVVKINDQEVQMNDMFKAQLIEEGLYDNSYVGVIVDESMGKITMEYLPVYGRSDRYVTKHLVATQEKAITASLREKAIGLLKRIR